MSDEKKVPGYGIGGRVKERDANGDITKMDMRYIAVVMVGPSGDTVIRGRIPLTSDHETIDPDGIDWSLFEGQVQAKDGDTIITVPLDWKAQESITRGLIRDAQGISIEGKKR